MTSDPFARDDAAYVLGALGPADRRAFEQHLTECAACTRAVADLAGLPALLAQVDEPLHADPEASPPLPETLLPRLLEEVRRRRRRVRLLAATGAAAAVVVVAVVSAVLFFGGSASEPQAQGEAQGEAMTQVDQDRLSATVSLEDVAWGTRMRLACTYRGGGWGEAPPAYALVVRTRDGSTEQVATWRGVPDQKTRLEAATAADPADIASVEVVVAGTGRTLLRLSPAHT